jgi:diaminopimelate epimerase
MRFWLMSALGNRFVVIPTQGDPQAPVLDGVERICYPRTGLGADGVVLVNMRKRYLHIYNADGGRAEVSGNGARCAAAWWFDRKHPGVATVVWHTDAGEVKCSRAGRVGVAVELPAPSFAVADIPAAVKSPELWGDKLELEYAGLAEIRVFALSVGNPQVVVWGARIPANWREIGQAIEGHRAFPERTNVVFARKTRAGIVVRTWERGAIGHRGRRRGDRGCAKGSDRPKH